MQEKSQNQKLYLRLAVKGGGCSGYEYKFHLEDKETGDDDRYTDNYFSLVPLKIKSMSQSVREIWRESSCGRKEYGTSEGIHR